MSRRSMSKGTLEEVSRKPSNSTHNFFDQDLPGSAEGLQASLQDRGGSRNSDRGGANNVEHRRGGRDEEEEMPDEESLAILNAHGFYYCPEPTFEHALAAMDHQADGPRPAEEEEGLLIQGPQPNPETTNGESATTGGSGTGDMQSLLPSISTYIASLAADNFNEAVSYAFALDPYEPMETVPAVVVGPSKSTSDLLVNENLLGNGVGNLPLHHSQGQIIDKQEGVELAENHQPRSLVDRHSGGGIDETGVSTGVGGSYITSAKDTIEDERGETQVLQMHENTSENYAWDLKTFSANIVSKVIENAQEQHKKENANEKQGQTHKDLSLCLGLRGVSRASNSKVSSIGDRYDYESDFEEDADTIPSAKIESDMPVKQGKSLSEDEPGNVKLTEKPAQENLVSLHSSASQEDIVKGKSPVMPNLQDVPPTPCRRYEDSLKPRPPTRSKIDTPVNLKRGKRQEGQVRKIQTLGSPSRNATSRAYGVKINEKSSPLKNRKEECKLPPVKMNSQEKKVLSSTATRKTTGRNVEKLTQKQSISELRKGKQTGSLSTVRKNVSKTNKTQQARSKSPKLPPLEKRRLSQDRNGMDTKGPEPRTRPDQLIRALGAGARKLRDMEKATLSETTVVDHESSKFSSPHGSKKGSKILANAYDQGKGSRFNLRNMRVSNVETQSVNGEMKTVGKQRLKPTLPSVLKSEAYWQNGQLHIRINGSARLIPQAEKIMEQGAGADGDPVPLDVRITLVKGTKTAAKPVPERQQKTTGGVYSRGYNGPLAYPELGVNKNPSRVVAERTILDTRTVHAPFNTRTTARVRAMPRRSQRSVDSGSSSGAGKM